MSMVHAWKHPFRPTDLIGGDAPDYVTDGHRARRAQKSAQIPAVKLGSDA